MRGKKRDVWQIWCLFSLNIIILLCHTNQTKIDFKYQCLCSDFLSGTQCSYKTQKNWGQNITSRLQKMDHFCLINLGILRRCEFWKYIHQNPYLLYSSGVRVIMPGNLCTYIEGMVTRQYLSQNMTVSPYCCIITWQIY